MRRFSFPTILTLSVLFLSAATGIHAAGDNPSQTVPEALTIEAIKGQLAEKQVIRTFHLENLALKEAMTMVRSLTGTKNVAVSEDLNILVVRDSAGKVEVIEKLLQSIDKPQAEVAIDVEFLYLKGGMPGHVSGDHRLPAEALANLRQSGRSLMQQEISILENDTANWTLGDRVPTHESLFGFELQIMPRVHPTSDEVTLKLAFQLSDSNPDAGTVLSKNNFESKTRLQIGEALLFSGLTVGTATGGQSSWLMSRFDLPKGPGEIVLALTPRIVREPGFTESDLAAICVGTKHHIGLCDSADFSRTVALKAATASLPNAGGEINEEDREAIRQRLRQKLQDLPEASETE